ncbi:hypothetical protein GCM10027413_04260 [Conyzicola nivalis]|uniref:Uncharacterized protein n=1 Tax=Conyzicola nivalis TaxID=1477021 RepID=A0A916SM73_9MICO|nr:hypothetical protein [Conyzicola nivalis]GGB07377.1 hypothetical protein GCM10010979_22370 [Conyzicola nivalis]
MNGWLVLAIVALATVAIWIAQRFGWIDLSNKNQNSGPRGGVMGVGDEVFNPTRHEAQVELDRQTVLPAPAPVAGDGDKGVYGGRVEIDLGEDVAQPAARRSPRH